MRNYGFNLFDVPKIVCSIVKLRLIKFFGIRNNYSSVMSNFDIGAYVMFSCPSIIHQSKSLFLSNGAFKVYRTTKPRSKTVHSGSQKADYRL